MEHIKRSIKINEQYQQAEQYSKKMNGISRVTNWHESKVKYDRANVNKQEAKLIQQEMRNAQTELFKARNIRLKQLYEEEAQVWEKLLAQKGLAIHKIKP